MVKTTLYTSTGQEAAHVLIPPFIPEAEVIVWGSRVFVWQKDTKRYVEGMAFWAQLTAE